MPRLYRVAPWREGAAAGEPGHPLYVPPLQTGSRIDNPVHYRALYTSEHAVGAVGEAFGGRLTWTESMFQSARVPGARKALIEYSADIRVTDLDDGRALAGRSLKPSHVASPDRETTQEWALRIYQEGGSDGIRWWSVYDARWGIFGLWNLTGVEVAELTPLDRSLPIVHEAAAALRRAWGD